MKAAVAEMQDNTFRSVVVLTHAELAQLQAGKMITNSHFVFAAAKDDAAAEKVLARIASK